MLPILYRDEALIAVHKPAGLLVHRSNLDAHEERFALQMLRDQIGQPVWPLHRLDKGTSGVLLFGLSAEVASLMGPAFEQGGARKRYRALVRGWPAQDEGLIDHPLARDPERPSTGQKMLAARTGWQVLHRLEWPLAVDTRFATSRFSLLELRPQEGRRHQIRRHLKHIAHPIVGDATHGKGPMNRAVAAYLGLQRLWLHALELEIAHPFAPAGRQLLKLRAEPGEEWQRLLPAPALTPPC